MRRAPVLAVLALVACATVPTQTRFMEEQGVKVSTEALRTRLRGEALPFTGLMAQAADEVRAASPDPGVRRRTLVWKINVVPALYRSLFNQRPLVALLDTWALILQAEGYLRSADAREAFGPAGAERILATTLDLEVRVREIAAWAAPEKDPARLRSRLQAWAAEHPVPITFATREGVEGALAAIAPPEELGLAAVAGRVNEDLDGIVARIDYLPTMVPHQATWQAELTYLDLVDPRMEVMLARGGAALDKFDAMIAWLGTDGLDAFAEEQRIQIGRVLGEQRVELERLVDRQRAELQAFADRERVEVLAAVQRERAAILADARQLTDHAAAEASRRARDVVDHLLSRLAVLLGVAIAGGLAIAWVARRPRPPAA
jgi:hypothetical protein